MPHVDISNNYNSSYQSGKYIPFLSLDVYFYDSKIEKYMQLCFYNTKSLNIKDD
jgi:hypothetical protein